MWLRMATNDPPPVLAQRLADFFLSTFTCQCGMIHNALRTPCKTEDENGDEE